MIDEQSSASGHDYALDRSAIGAGHTNVGSVHPIPVKLQCPGCFILLAFVKSA